MSASAPAFFNDLNRLLIEYLYLRICLITDPAASPARGGPRNNLTCHFLNEELQKANAGRLPDEIKTLTGEFVRLRDFLLPARNKFLAHLDVEHVLAAQDLGAHPEQESTLFFEATQNYCDAVGLHVGEGPLDFTGSGRGPGDIMDLLRTVQLGLAAKEQRMGETDEFKWDD